MFVLLIFCRFYRNCSQWIAISCGVYHTCNPPIRISVFIVINLLFRSVIMWLIKEEINKINMQHKITWQIQNINLAWLRLPFLNWLVKWVATIKQWVIAVEDCEVNRRSGKSVWPRVPGIVESIHLWALRLCDGICTQNSFAFKIWKNYVTINYSWLSRLLWFSRCQCLSSTEKKHIFEALF